MDREELRKVALEGWDGLAEVYSQELYDELEHKPYDRALLKRLVEMSPGGPLLDLGCGPGHVAAHLAGLGAEVHGIDLAPRMVEIAAVLQPELTFEVGDMLELELEPGRFGGAVILYCLINLVREDVTKVLETVHYGLCKGAPILIAVHEGTGEVRENEVFGRPAEMVATLFELEELSGYVRTAGFEIVKAETRPHCEREYPSQRVYVLARRR